jgi:tetratricopeptide (TPR) repeat protein
MEAGLSHADEVLNPETDAELEEMDDAEDVVEMSKDIEASNETEETIVEVDSDSIPVVVEEESEFLDELSKESDEMDVAVLEEEGKRFLQKEDWETAFQYFDQLVRLDNKRVDNWVNRGRALEMLKREDEAIESYDHAIHTNPDLPSPFLYKAALLSRLERFEEAQKFYNVALSKVPVQKSEKTPVA